MRLPAAQPPHRFLPLVVALLAACQAAESPETSGAEAGRVLPLPLERDPEVREEMQREREAWMAERHRAAPGVDWRAIEEQNARAEMLRRSAPLEGPMAPVGGFWSEVGSRNQAGRMHCAVLGPVRADAPEGRFLYAGSNLGGMWRGNPSGTEWTPLGDNLYGGVHEIVALPAVVAGDPDVLVVTQDDGDVYRSVDGGQTWVTPAGLPALSSARGLAALQDTARTIVLYGEWASRGRVYTSSDLGQSFTLRWTGPVNWPGDIWVPRTGPEAVNTVYLLRSNQVLKSTDGGVTFTTLANVGSTGSRGRLVGSEAGAPRLYVAALEGSQWRLYRSDGGVSWTSVSDLDHLWTGNSWESFQASSVNPDLLASADIETWRSFNGGASFQRQNTWGSYYGDPANRLHADVPGIHCWPDPDDPGAEIWYVSTDGGLYESRDGFVTVQNLSLSGLGVSQYYSTLTSSIDTELILAGAQDQGYQRGRYAGPGIDGPSTDFDQLISGDYGHLTSSSGGHGKVYSVYPGFILVQQGEQNPQLQFPVLDFPAGSNHGWLPMVQADPIAPGTVFLCADVLYRFTQVSGPNFSQAVHSAHDFLVGGANYLTAIDFAPSDPQRVYAANDRGRLFFSTDHGVTWTNSASIGPDPHYFYGTAIDVNPDDALEAVVGGSGYSGPAVFRTTNGGATWQAESAGLPPTLVYDLAWAADGGGDLYAATETGAWRWRRSTGQWTSIAHDRTPITIYWSVEAVPSANVMRFGTYGRGIWDYHLPLATGPDVAGGTPRWRTIAVGGSSLALIAEGGDTTDGSGTTLRVRAPEHAGRKVLLLWSVEPDATRPDWLIANRPEGRIPVQLDGEGAGEIVLPRFPATIPSGGSLSLQAVLPGRLVDGAPRRSDLLVLSTKR